MNPYKFISIRKKKSLDQVRVNGELIVHSVLIWVSTRIGVNHVILARPYLGKNGPVLPQLENLIKGVEKS